MTSRHPVLALSKLKPEMYESSIQFLKGLIYIMMDIELGYKRTWKPSQKGSILATSILDIQTIYLDDKGFNFILTSRFTEDCLENVFSIMRTKNIVPNALQVKNNLKLLSVSQYLKDISKGNYNEDDRTFLSGFLDTLEDSNHKDKKIENIQLPQEINEPNMNLCNGELNSFYNVCGYILYSNIALKKNNYL